MKIVFKTDKSRNATGFKALWSSLEGNIIKSPNSPLFYPNNADQVKLIHRKYMFDINCCVLYRHGHLMWMMDRG